MKNIFSKTALLGIFALASTSCNDSFLERTPTNDLKSQTFWKTTADGYSGKTRSVIPMEAISDNYATVDGSQTWASAIAAGLETIPSNYNSPSYGGWVWTALHRINTFMDSYDRVQVTSPEQATLKRGFFGEAALFRAWFYLDKVQKYGDVPLITHALNITQGTALALKARICLYEGTYRKYHKLSDKTDYDTWFAGAVDAAEKCMTLGYEICNTGNPNKDYAALFTTDDLEGNKEMLMYRKYATGLLMHRQCGYIINIRAGGTKDFADDFLCVEDGKAIPTGLVMLRFYLVWQKPKQSWEL